MSSHRVTVAKFLLLAFFSFWWGVPSVDADVRLPAVLSDRMVLQQQTSVPFWGWATPDETVEISCGWATSPMSVTADEGGRWMTRIETPAAGGPYDIEIRGNNMIRLTDVLVGEVWFASGQSNMGMPVGRRPTWKHGIIDWEKEVAAADHPRIRLFGVPKKAREKPQADTEGTWAACSPTSVHEFSAVAYFFGRELHRELDVPIGLFDASFAGSLAEAWMTGPFLRSDPDFKPILARYEQAVAEYPQALEEYDRARVEWRRQVDEAEASGAKTPRPPRKPLGPGHPNSPTAIYNGMVAPVLPYAIRGVIWYQGESNRARGHQYAKLFPALIRNWRDDWRQGDFPFYYVQIGPYPYRQEPLAAAELRDSQRLALSVPNTGMVVTADVANPADLHPQNKQDVGRRLALWALAKTYGRANVVCSGPLYREMEIEGDRIRLSFDCIDGGLTVKGGGQLTHFLIAGEDQEFHDAAATIEGDTVVVRSPNVPRPVAVRFGWTNDAVPNLFNGAGLPASLFRTDSWPGVTYGER